MELRRSQFREDDIDRHGMGAGILPFARDADGNLFVLLGRERYMPSWKGSCRWSGFEGSRKEHEPIAETALREFEEESLGVVACADALRRRLQDDDYSMRIVLKIVNERRAERYHCTYVVEVPWQPELPDAFRKTRSNIEHIDRLAQEWRHRRPELFQDTSDVGPILDTSGAHDAVSARVSRDSLAVPCILRAPWEFQHQDGDPEREGVQLVTAQVHGPCAQGVLEWSVLRDRLERALIGHPCIRVNRDPAFGLIQDVHILKDHLEKDQMRWWSVDELYNVIAHKGSHGGERFRPYFMPVLQTFLHEIAPRVEKLICGDAQDECDELA